MSLVVDPSVAVKWYLEDELSPEADPILNLVEVQGAVVPALFRWDVQNVLRQAQVSGGISDDGLDEALASLRELPIEVDDAGSRIFFGGELRLAQVYELTVYDAAYLALATDQGIALATADFQLARAAREHGVAVELL